jgi:hypothetical protein
MSNAHVDASVYNTQKLDEGATVISFKARSAAKPKQKIFFTTPSIFVSHSAAPTHSIVLGKVLLFEAGIGSLEWSTNRLVALCWLMTDWEHGFTKKSIRLEREGVDWKTTFSRIYHSGPSHCYMHEVHLLDSETDLPNTMRTLLMDT